jgi:hypothetical protein
MNDAETDPQAATITAVINAIRTAREDGFDAVAEAIAVLDAIKAAGYITRGEAIAAVDLVLRHDQDAVHESLCSCDSYPTSCVTYSDLGAVLPDRVYPEDVAAALLSPGAPA